MDLAKPASENMNDQDNMKAFTKSVKTATPQPHKKSNYGYGRSDGKRRGPSRRPRSEVRQYIEQIITGVAAEDLVGLFFSKQEADEMLGNSGHYAGIWREAIEAACLELVKRSEAEKEKKR